MALGARVYIIETCNGKYMTILTTPNVHVHTSQESGQTLTLVAMIIWSRLPLLSIHSPRKSSESSSWLIQKFERQVPASSEESKEMNALAIRRIDEVPSELVKPVQKLEARLLVHGAHTLIGPFATDTHGAKLPMRQREPARRQYFKIRTR